MAIIQEVSDAIAAVANSVHNIRTISDAVRNGTDYLKTNHPNVADDLAAMCEEMRKSSQALAAASSIVTHFRFVIGGALASEAARFNEHLVAHKTQAEAVEQRLNTMRGHCHIIEQHAANIRERATPTGLRSFAAALGLHSTEREAALAAALQGIYDEEIQYHQGVYAMAAAINMALQEVQNTLGPAGMIDPDKVPDAGATLGEYASVFSRLEAECNYNALQLQDSIDTLREAV